MDETALLDRIIEDPNVLVGKPIIRGMRISVEMVLHMLAAKNSIVSILEEYPFLEEDDIYACMLYGAKMVDAYAFERRNEDEPEYERVSGDELAEMLNKSVDDPAVAELLERFRFLPLNSRYADCYERYLESRPTGIGLRRNESGALDTVYLYLVAKDGFRPFLGGHFLAASIMRMEFSRCAENWERRLGQESQPAFQYMAPGTALTMPR